MKSPTSKLFPAMLDTHSKTFTKQTLVGWPSIPGLKRMKRKIGSRMRSGQAPGSSLAALETSFDPRDTLKSLRAHKWSIYDGQYVFIIILGIFCLSIMEFPGPLIKTGVASLLMLAMLMPITRQFWLPFLPVVSWLVFFFSCRFIPAEIRPHIWVRVLPALENIIYGANLSNILSAQQNAVLDVLAWLPYGIIHFAGPFLTAAALFVWGAPGTVNVFSSSFGYMNIIGVSIQLFFPCAPPWYQNLHGFSPANYSMPGSPAGLARIDKLFGLDMYSSSFTASPMVFGAMPSLHAGCATIEALFLAHVFPRLRWVFYGYIAWIWWATLYLQHHYAVDLIAGSLLAGAVFYVAKIKFLPRTQLDKECRWDYDFVEIGNSCSYDLTYSLHDFDGDYHSEDDEWTSASSSSVSSGCRTPVDDTAGFWESANEISNIEESDRV
ncbi:PAP2-domain-containing protein [Morchella conica CCBAS932]|uniref:PAP2-domain-containing protein n=2 Tax=Morchella sect. Distantes TaxID=1051054 RepID=A0A3N4KKK9_9PEZI|nr:PAP2-domain-containing protein [Morchella conica CCBAS932]